LGIGFEQFIYKDFLAFNIEYNYANYGSVSTSTPLVGYSEATGYFYNGTTQASANAKVSTLLGGISWYFGSHLF
jgi:hypothetical protein